MTKKSNIFITIVIALISVMGLCILCTGGYLAISIASEFARVLSTPPIAPYPGIIQTPKLVEQIPLDTLTFTPLPPTDFPSPTISPSDTPIPTIALPDVAACIPNNPRETGIVTKIIDGDTIEVAIQGASFTVRYIGIDTPESNGEVYASEATQLNRDLVEGKTVVLVKDVNETDKYDRLLRYVMVGDAFVNYELVKQGLAYAKDYPPDSACSEAFQLAQSEAQTANLSLWSPEFAVRLTASAIPPIMTPITRSGGEVEAPCACAGPDLDCSDFPTHAAAQACWDYCSAQGIDNPYNLDGSDDDGQVCELLP